MFPQFIRPLRVLLQFFAAAGTPRQLALGFALGMVVGLVPKGNLTAVVLVTALLATRVNLGTGMVAAVVFSWVGMLADPLSHRIGLLFLTKQSLQPMWTYLYDLPVVPWTGLNNTVVLGSLLLGAWLFYPVYRLSEAGFARGRPWLVERLKGRRIVQLLWGTEVAASWSAQ